MLLEDIILEQKMISGSSFTFIDLEEAIGNERVVGYMNFYYMAFTNDVDDWKAVIFLSTKDQKKQYKYFISNAGVIYPANRTRTNKFTFRHFEIIEHTRKVYAKCLKDKEVDSEEEVIDDVTVTVTKEDDQYEEIDRNLGLDLLQDIKGVGKVKAKKILDAFLTGEEPDRVSDRILAEAKGILQSVAVR